jgi:hypothetical protein
MSKVIENNSTSRPETEPTTKGNTFVTDLTLNNKKNTPKKKTTQMRFIISLESINDPNAIKALEDTLKEKMGKVNFDSPRTNKVMDKLGILYEECEMK